MEGTLSSIVKLEQDYKEWKGDPIWLDKLADKIQK
jgi:hypothetical protein